MVDISETTGIVIAHFDPKGRVARHLSEFVDYARCHLTPHIVFVSTGLSDDGERSLEGRCQVIRRENIGYDFWSYKIGIDALRDRGPWDRLLIINSSIVILDPERLASQIFDRKAEEGLVGLTFSREIGPHIQSYCVMFEGRGFIESDAMQRWWGDMIPISDRELVIHKYEIGMSQYFIKRNAYVRPLYVPTQGEKLVAITRAIAQSMLPVQIPQNQHTVEVKLEQGTNLNPTHFMWDAVLRQFGIVKIDFLRKSLFAAQCRDLVSQSPEWTDRSALDLIMDALS